MELQVARKKKKKIDLDIFTLKCNFKNVTLSCSTFETLSLEAYMIFRENIIPQIPSYFKSDDLK